MNTEIEFTSEHIEKTSTTSDRLTVISTSGSSTNAKNDETATELETARDESDEPAIRPDEIRIYG